MASMAIPLIEGAALWLLRALGLTAGAVLVGTETRDKDKDKDDAQTNAPATTRTRTRTCRCPPKNNGQPSPDLPMPPIARQYQDQVTEVTGYPKGTEWLLDGRRFDGFREPLCQLEEAKSNYDKFFDEESGDPLHWWLNTGAEEMVVTAGVQNMIALANLPCVLRWYFMEPISHRYFTRRFARSAYFIVTQFEPMRPVPQM